MKHLTTVVLLVAACGAASAQSKDAELIQRLLERVDQLERRIAELESARGGRPADSQPLAAATAPSPAPGPAGHAAHGMAGMAMQPDTPTVLDTGEFTKPVFALSGFSDINFAASTDKRARSGFSEGQFVLHMTSQLSRKVSYFGEVSFTARADGGIGSPPATGFNAEIERSIIRYENNDLFKVSFGRYHTPINYWNTAFHHGSWLQTTAERPEVTRFGGSFIPVHFVGTLVEGAVDAGGLNLNYNAGIGNGRGGVINRSGDFGDINNAKAWLLSAFSRPDRIYGLQIGGALYRDKISRIGFPEVREWIHSAHVVWDKENPEFIAEFTNVRHKPVLGGKATNSRAFYAQVAWRLDAFERKFKPYFRYEKIAIPTTDFVFTGVPDLSGSTFGLRYEVAPFSAVKFEYRRYLRTAAPLANGLVMQTSFTF
ncbi:MAG: hypothetical protein R2729_29280 [Bryobacteraceae bacterium]